MENSVWSKDYQHAKKKFHNSIDSLIAKNINVFHDQLNINELDPYGNNLTIDIAWIGDSNAEKVYMSTSGIHGVEGFAGSAIQLTLLNNFNKIPNIFLI